jgi:hypothetical protein
LVVGALAAAASFLPACRKSEAPSPEPAATAAPASDAATAAAPAEPAAAPEAAPASLAPAGAPQGGGAVTVLVGTSGDTENGVGAGETSFSVRSVVTAAVDVGGLPPGAILKVTWVDELGRTQGESHTQVPSGVRWLLVGAAHSSSWAVGTYRVDVLVSTGGSGSRTFQITPRVEREETPVPG